MSNCSSLKGRHFLNILKQIIWLTRLHTGPSQTLYIKSKKHKE